MLKISKNPSKNDPVPAPGLSYSQENVSITSPYRKYALLSTEVAAHKAEKPETAGPYPYEMEKFSTSFLLIDIQHKDHDQPHQKW